MFLFKSFSGTSESNIEKKPFWSWYKKSSASSHTKSPSTSKSIPPHKPIDKVLSMTESDDFVDIQYRKLSYAEAASLSLNNNAHNINYNADSSSNSKTILIDPLVDLNKSITDYQLYETYVKNKNELNSSRLKNEINHDAALDDEESSSSNDTINNFDELPEKFKSSSNYRNRISSKQTNKLNNLNKKSIKKAKKKAAKTLVTNTV